MSNRGHAGVEDHAFRQLLIGMNADFRLSRFDLLNDRRRRQVRTGNQQHYEQRSTNK
jgi:hypothetical protein